MSQAKLKCPIIPLTNIKGGRTMIKKKVLNWFLVFAGCYGIVFNVGILLTANDASLIFFPPFITIIACAATIYFSLRQIFGYHTEKGNDDNTA